jgi:hypothetical protein
MVFTECTTGMQFILAVPDGTPRLCDQMEARFDPFGDSVKLAGRLVHGLPQMDHRLRNQFRHTQLYSYMTWVN